MFLGILMGCRWCCSAAGRTGDGRSPCCLRTGTARTEAMNEKLTKAGQLFSDGLMGRIFFRGISSASGTAFSTVIRTGGTLRLPGRRRSAR